MTEKQADELNRVLMCIGKSLEAIAASLVQATEEPPCERCHGVGFYRAGGIEGKITCPVCLGVHLKR